MSTYGIKLEQQAYLANIETIANNYEFQKMMGFINTRPESQMKGIDGDVKWLSTVIKKWGPERFFFFKDSLFFLRKILGIILIEK